MISYILPTRNRPDCLRRTLAALGALAAHPAEVIVVDNAGDTPASTPRTLANGLSVRLIRRTANEGAAGRTAAALACDRASRWLVMLDDDSFPLDVAHVGLLQEQPEDVVALCAEIFLPDCCGRSMRESGGLPEIPIGCGVAYRRAAYLGAIVPGLGNVPGYDPRFGFYAEEYDLAARLMLAGGRIAFDRRFRVRHEKTPAGRSMDTILRRLVRNNTWVMRRYAPKTVRPVELRRAIMRYAGIARKEHAMVGYALGLVESLATLRSQPRLELPSTLWNRFVGKSACRCALLHVLNQRRFTTAMLVAPGKNEHIVRETLLELGVALTNRNDRADALVIGTLSPGPALDAYDMLAADPRVVAPWPMLPAHNATGESSGSAAINEQDGARTAA